MGFLLLGLDSLIVCAAVGPLVDKRWRVLFATLFGVADGVAFLIGAGLGWRLFSDGVSAGLQAGIVVALGLYLLLVAAGTRRVAARWPVWVFPHLLIFDNLTFGLAREHGALFQQAAQQALSSVLLAFVGLLLAAALRPAVARRADPTRVAGGALLAAAAALVLVG